ncbi:MAG: hypothetical protein R3278_04080, partial [Lysobacter spongiicola]|nr:hypothetical protein [Lysobacter spongiicola]
MQRSTIASLLLPAALCAPAPVLADAPPIDNALALDNVHIVEAEHNGISTPRCVRVEGDRIASIAAAGDPACLRGARPIDLEGRYLMPGLIDMHAHLTLGPLEIKHEDGEPVMQA